MKNWSVNSQSLKGKIAVVAGATRGAGRGIAAALGEAGATVICTGRTTRAEGSARSDYKRKETIEETAELVTSLGGEGIAMAVDHLNTAEVQKLSSEIEKRFGHIDILVNDIWGGELLKGGPDEWNVPIWEQDMEKGFRILRLAIDTHLITSHYLLPLLIKKSGGLVIEVTDGTNEYNSHEYRISAFYDLAKHSVNRLAYSQGHELKPYDATAIAITPGFLRSEMMLEHFGVTEENWQEVKEPASFAVSESTRYIGRAVAALASDPDRKRWNQKSVSSGQLAKIYGFRDIDNSQPQIWEFMLDSLTIKNLDPKKYR